MGEIQETERERERERERMKKLEMICCQILVTQTREGKKILKKNRKKS